MEQTTTHHFDIMLGCPFCALNAENDDELTYHLTHVHPSENAATEMKVAASTLYCNDMPWAAKLCADTATALLRDRPYSPLA